MKLENFKDTFEFKEYVKKNHKHLNTTILSFDEIYSYYENFIEKEIFYMNKEIDIDLIVGSENGNWYGNTYLQMIDYAERIDKNIKLFLKNPNYYTNYQKKYPELTIKIIKGNSIQGFVGEGNHRVLIAKMLKEIQPEFKKIYGVMLTEYKIDMDLFWHIHNNFNCLKEVEVTRIKDREEIDNIRHIRTIYYKHKIKIIKNNRLIDEFYFKDNKNKTCKDYLNLFEKLQLRFLKVLF